jgi:hypothetical protein
MNNSDQLNSALTLVKQADFLDTLKQYGGDALSSLSSGYKQYLEPYVNRGIGAASPYLEKFQDFVNNYRPLNAEDSWKGGLAAAGVGGLAGLLRNKMRDDEDEGDNRMSDIMTYAALMGLPVAAAPLLSNRLAGHMANRTTNDLLRGQGGINAAKNDPNFSLSDKQYDAASLQDPSFAKDYAAARSAQQPKGFLRGSNASTSSNLRGQIENMHSSGDMQRGFQHNLGNAGVMDLIRMLKNIPSDTSADVDYISKAFKDSQTAAADEIN